MFLLSKVELPNDYLANVHFYLRSGRIITLKLSRKVDLKLMLLFYCNILNSLRSILSFLCSLTSYILFCKNERIFHPCTRGSLHVLVTLLAIEQTFFRATEDLLYHSGVPNSYCSPQSGFLLQYSSLCDPYHIRLHFSSCKPKNNVNLVSS